MKDITVQELEKARKQKEIDDWRVLVTNRRRANQYITRGQETESVLESHRQEIHVTIYKKIGSKELGDSSFTVTDRSAAAISQQIKEAVMLAKHSKKERYTIPKAARIVKRTRLADKKILDSFEQDTIHVDMKKICKRLGDRVKRHKNIEMNSMELLVSSFSSEVINSRKLRLLQAKTFVYLEMVLTASSGKKEMEFYPALKVSRLADINVNRFVDDNVQKAKDVLASIPAPDFQGDVMLSDDAVKEYFMPELTLSPLFIHCGARIKYLGLSRYEKGRPIAKEFKGERITAYTSPLLAYNPASSDYDEDGVASRRVKILDKGICSEYISSKRFADYLKIRPTGAIGSIEIAPGKKTVKQLCKAKDFIEIIAFSSFSPNSVSGDFSAEIRLGYVWKDGKKTAFKGGMFTGNAFKLIENVHFSKEMKKVEGYHGPKAVVFHDAIIAGI